MTDVTRVGTRLRLSRARGWRLPVSARSVAYPTRWSNPFRPRERGVAANTWAVEQYRRHLDQHPELVVEARVALAGFDLACWCALDLPCHADVLLEMVARKPSAR